MALDTVIHELQEEYFAMNTTQTMLNRIPDTTCSLKRQDTCTIHRAINHKIVNSTFGKHYLN